jgi:hypothetical protein
VLPNPLMPNTFVAQAYLLHSIRENIYLTQ